MEKILLTLDCFTNSAYYVCDIMSGEPVAVYRYKIDDENIEYIKAFDRENKIAIHSGAHSASEWIDLVGAEDERTTGRNFVTGLRTKGATSDSVAVRGNEENDDVPKQGRSQDGNGSVRVGSWSKATIKDITDEVGSLSGSRPKEASSIGESANSIAQDGTARQRG